MQGIAQRYKQAKVNSLEMYYWVFLVVATSFSNRIMVIAYRQLFCLVKFSFPVTRLMPYYAETGHSRPPHHGTL